MRRRGPSLSFAVAALALASCPSPSPHATAQERKTMTGPLELRIAAVKSRTIAREGIRLEVTRTLARDLPMDSVELNAERTRVTVKPLGGSEPARELSGKDYAALYHHHPLKEIGSHYEDKAGTWTSILDLWNYTRPLAPGRYEIALSYRWGDTPAETARSNEVTVEVAPAKGLSFEPRWLAGGRPREDLGSIWTARDGGTVRWVFEVAFGEDPTVVRSAIDLDAPALEPLAPPCLPRPSGWATSSTRSGSRRGASAGCRSSPTSGSRRPLTRRTVSSTSRGRASPTRRSAVTRAASSRSSSAASRPAPRPRSSRSTRA